MYNAAKPSKYHIKTFGLCDSITGYVYNILTYFGRETSYNPELDSDCGEAVKVFEYLLQNLGLGHHIFADRYYTSMKLIRYLQTRSTHYTGTVNTRRVGFPTEIRDQTLRLEHRKSKTFLSKDKDLLCCAWRDKKAKNPCVLVSTKLRCEQVEVERGRQREKVKMPVLVRSYNMSMNGCDRLDQAVSYYGQYGRKTVKWWKRIFLWLLEVTQVNAHILYCLSHPGKPLPLLDYKRRLRSQLEAKAATLCYDDPSSQGRGRPSKVPDIERLSHKRHLVVHKSADRNCTVCSTTAKRRRTSFYCSTCNVYLHAKDCFAKYHARDNGAGDS